MYVYCGFLVLVCCLILIFIIFHIYERFLGFITFNKRPFMGFSKY
jgi:hypothetical protein